jgi:hypothetical protein
MDGKFSRRPGFDALEDRVSLSVAPAAHAASTALKGALLIPVPAGTAPGNSLRIEGNGNIAPLGPVSALGTLNENGRGVGSGTLDLASGDGGIVVDLQATAGHGRHAAPKIRFTIIGGTGSFTHAAGSGTATESGGKSGLLTFTLRGTLTGAS